MLPVAAAVYFTVGAIAMLLLTKDHVALGAEIGQKKDSRRDNGQDDIPGFTNPYATYPTQTYGYNAHKVVNPSNDAMDKFQAKVRAEEQRKLEQLKKQADYVSPFDGKAQAQRQAQDMIKPQQRRQPKF